MNLQTGHVTPQFHVTFDGGFTNIHFLDKKDTPPNWTDLFHSHTENYDANNLGDITASEGDYASSSDTSISEGDDHLDPVSIIAPQVQDILGGKAFDSVVDQNCMPPNDNDNPISIPEYNSNPPPFSEGELHGSNSLLPPE